MSSVLLANNRTAHEERIISVQPRTRHMVGGLLQSVTQAWLSTEMNLLLARVDERAVGHPAQPPELLGGPQERI